MIGQAMLDAAIAGAALFFVTLVFVTIEEAIRR